MSLLHVALSGRRPILTGALACAVTAFLALSFVSPTYEADSQIILEPNTASVIDIPDVVSEAPDGVATIEGAIIVMRSPAILQDVVTELGLTEYPEFNSALRTPGPVARVRSAVSGLVGLLTGSGGGAVEAASPDDTVARVARSLRKVVSVRSIGESRVIEITTTLDDPRLAAAISNAVARQYLAEQIALQEAAGDRATVWLEDRAEQLRDELIASERRMGDFRRDMLANGRLMATDLETRQAETTLQINALTQDRAALAGKRDEVGELLAAGSYPSLALAADLPSLTLAVEQLAVIEGQIIERRAEFGDHPRTIEAQTARDLIMARIRDETEQYLAGMDVRLRVLDDRLTRLAEQRAEIRGALVEAQEDELTMLTLEREAEAAREVFELFTLRLREVRERGQLPSPGARLVSEATAPSSPVAPQKTKLAGLAGLAGGGAVLGALLLYRSRRTAVTILDDPRVQKGTSRLVDLPRTDRLRTPDDLMAAMQGIEDPGLLHAVHWLGRRVGPRSRDWATLIVVASADDDGAARPSSLPLLLAQSLAQDHSTVLVDANPSGGWLTAFASMPGFDMLGFRYLDCAGMHMDEIEDLLSVDTSLDADSDALLNAEVIVLDMQAKSRDAVLNDVAQLADHVVLTSPRDKPGEAALRRAAAVIGGAPSALGGRDARPRGSLRHPAGWSGFGGAGGLVPGQQDQ